MQSSAAAAPAQQQAFLQARVPASDGAGARPSKQQPCKKPKPIKARGIARRKKPTTPKQMQPSREAVPWPRSSATIPTRSRGSGRGRAVGGADRNTQSRTRRTIAVGGAVEGGEATGLARLDRHRQWHAIHVACGVSGQFGRFASKIEGLAIRCDHRSKCSSRAQLFCA